MHKVSTRLFAQIAEHMYDVHSYLRMNTPADHVVLTTPVLPMNILVDHLPQPLVSSIMNGSNSIKVPAAEVIKIQRPYELMFSRSLAIHSANAAHENVYQVPKSAVCHGLVRVVDTAQQLGQFFMSSPWHVAIESMVVRALYGLPSPYLRHLSNDATFSSKDLEMETRLSNAVIVGNINIEMNSVLTKKKVTVRKRPLKFSPADLVFIIENYAKPEPKDNPVTWCLTCPFPATFMKSEFFEKCVEQKCKSRLRIWTFKSSVKDKGCESVLCDMRTFLTKVQSGLPRGNYANVFPISPTTVVTFDQLQDQQQRQLLHDQLHQLQDQYGSKDDGAEERVLLSTEPLAKVEEMVACVRRGWLTMFHTTKLGHSPATEDGFSCLSACAVQTAATHLKATWHQQWQAWSTTATSYIADYSPLLKG